MTANLGGSGASGAVSGGKEADEPVGFICDLHHTLFAIHCSLGKVFMPVPGAVF